MERALEATGTLDASLETRAQSEVVRHPDPHFRAWVRLLLGAARSETQQPETAIERLSTARDFFDAACLRDEAGLARLEMATRRAFALSPHEALSLLSEDPFNCPLLGPSGGAALALCSLVLLDVGRVQEARMSLSAALRHFQAGTTSGSGRQQARSLRWIVEMLLGEWLGTLGIDTCLSEGFLLNQSADVPAKREIEWRMHVCLSQLAQSQDPNVETATLMVLHDAALQREGAAVASRLDRLHGHLLAQGPSTSPQAWLNLAIAQRLAGRQGPALDGLARALDTASRTGSRRVQKLALYEKAAMCAETQGPSWGYEALLQMRRLERAMGASHQPARSSVLHDQLATPARISRARQHVVKAQECISKHLSEPLNVSQVAAYSGVSRRTLELAFRAEEGITVSECLRVMRSKEVMRRLLQTDHAIKRIAVDLAYVSASALCREFRTVTGMTPAQYRRSLHADPGAATHVPTDPSSQPETGDG